MKGTALRRGEGPQNPLCIGGLRLWLALSAESSNVPTSLAVCHLRGVSSWEGFGCAVLTCGCSEGGARSDLRAWCGGRMPRRAGGCQSVWMILELPMLKNRTGTAERRGGSAPWSNLVPSSRHPALLRWGKGGLFEETSLVLQGETPQVCPFPPLRSAPPPLGQPCPPSVTHPAELRGCLRSPRSLGPVTLSSEASDGGDAFSPNPLIALRCWLRYGLGISRWVRVAPSSQLAFSLNSLDLEGEHCCSPQQVLVEAQDLAVVFLRWSEL